jgi:hypothetical protein
MTELIATILAWAILITIIIPGAIVVMYVLLHIFVEPLIDIFMLKVVDPVECRVRGFLERRANK